VGKPEGRRPLGKPRFKWEDNIKTDLKDWDEGMGWIGLMRDKNMCQAFVNQVVNPQVP